MTEARIFQILLDRSQESPQPQNRFDYPKLHPDSANLLASSFTDIIYDTLKTKGSCPRNRRHDVLKLLQTLPRNIDNHLSITDENCDLFLNSVRGIYGSELDHSFNSFLTQVEAELRQTVPQSLCETVLNFNRKRDEKRRVKTEILEDIQKHDQEALRNTNFYLKTTKNVYSETNENLIKALLQQTISTFPSNIAETSEYREKQIKFAYALVNLKKLDLLLLVVEKLSQYQSLILVETNFVNFLAFSLDDSFNSSKIKRLLAEKFTFVYEKTIVKHCKAILSLSASDLVDYFENLLFDEKLVTIKKIAENNELFTAKLKNLLYFLYFYSYCNGNVIKFSTFLL